jgi:structure-specific recognition protein 1
MQNPGQFKVHYGGLAWKRQGGGKTIDIDKADVTTVTWMKVPRAYQLGVRIKDGLLYRFIGFREQVSFLSLVIYVICLWFSIFLL